MTKKIKQNYDKRLLKFNFVKGTSHCRPPALNRAVVHSTLKNPSKLIVWFRTKYIISCFPSDTQTLPEAYLQDDFSRCLFWLMEIRRAKWHASGNKNSSAQFPCDGTWNVPARRHSARWGISNLVELKFVLCKSLNSEANCKVKWQTTNSCHRHWLTMLGSRVGDYEQFFCARSIDLSEICKWSRERD